MACSKFFSGDLPELLNEVIQYFHYDYKTLHSCILVNRLWCRLAIPLLWEDPFSIKSPKNYRFIEIYLSNFSNDDKTKLNEYVIHNDVFPSNTLFNYPKFIQHLDTYKVCNTIGKWITSISITSGQHSNYSMRNINLSVSQMLNFTNLIFKSFFLIFIKNEVNLHSFGITIDSYKETECFDTTFELILQNTNFFYNIKNFTLDLIEITDNITKFLEFLCSNCNSISSFHFLLPIKNNSHPIIEKILSQMIKLQENLKKITFGYDYSTPLSLLLSLKNPNCSNTLNTIIFYSIDFRNINILSELFNHLNVLESIHIVYCYSLDSKFIRQINNVTKPFKLKSLILNHIDELLDPLIQKSGNYLENFRIPKFGLQQLLQPIKLYCSNIKFLSIQLHYKNINLIFDLIKNIKQNLDYLIIDSSIIFQVFGNIKFNSTVLQNLGQILPLKLEYLNLIINESDLEIFLKNSQNTYIKKLAIRNAKDDGSQDILPYIKEYIMKKKRVKYLAISGIFHEKSVDLFSLKDEVKEFQLYDIQVLNYNDSVIDVYDFIIKETY
ncbi:hypothetical protein RhiirC2_790876 [Rhizophagus irregularis]|uniref:F-box domain-containing protein n=2 Tax=Rhizophagus irregularis TaxID=588596 RepID=A0A2N1MF77_9GLOM|nr:hypothetical protein RhiirC2_793553 [Rhizophagus irregularis]PKK62092.1 hypothetical protein RhiirC2_790876 [Rhizophagus irregularis]